MDIIIVDNDTTLRARFVKWITEYFAVDDRGDLEWVLGMQVTRNRAVYDFTCSSSGHGGLTRPLVLYVLHIVVDYIVGFPIPVEQVDTLEG